MAKIISITTKKELVKQELDELKLVECVHPENKYIIMFQGDAVGYVRTNFHINYFYPLDFCLFKSELLIAIYNKLRELNEACNEHFS